MPLATATERQEINARFNRSDRWFNSNDPGTAKQAIDENVVSHDISHFLVFISLEGCRERGETLTRTKGGNGNRLRVACESLLENHESETSASAYASASRRRREEQRARSEQASHEE